MATKQSILLAIGTLLLSPVLHCEEFGQVLKSTPKYVPEAYIKQPIILCFIPMQDSKADLIIHGYVDDVMRDLLDQLQLALPGSHDNTSPSVKDRTHENISHQSKRGHVKTSHHTSLK